MTKNQGKFWNLLIKRFLKLILIFDFDKELTEIFKVEEPSFERNTCVLPQITQLKLHQIKLVGGVSKSSQRVEFNTVIGFQILARFH